MHCQFGNVNVIYDPSTAITGTIASHIVYSLAFNFHIILWTLRVSLNLLSESRHGY